MPKKKLINLLLNVITDGKENYYEPMKTIPEDAVIPEIDAEVVIGDRTFVVTGTETDEELAHGVRHRRNTRYIYLQETSPEPETFEQIKAKKKIVRAARNEALRERMKQVNLKINRKKKEKDG